MKNEAIIKIKQARLSRQAQSKSGLKDKIKSLQKEIVVQSFSKKFDRINHETNMKQLKKLKKDYIKIGGINCC